MCIRDRASLNSDSSIARTGRYSGRIKSKMGGGAELHIVPYLEAGEYILSGWVKTDGVEGNNGVLLKAEGSGMKAKESPNLKGTNEDWQKLQLNFKVDYDSGVLIYCLFVNCIMPFYSSRYYVVNRTVTWIPI